MATKDEILTGIREVEKRLDSMLPGILANLDQPLPEGSWSVHDALCHMADDVPALPRWQRIVAGAPRPPGFNIDEVNQRGIDERKDKPVDEIVQEIRDGLHADAATVPGLDDAQLMQLIPTRSGDLQPASDRLMFTSVGHNHLHLDDIEKAISARTIT